MNTLINSIKSRLIVCSVMFFLITFSNMCFAETKSELVFLTWSEYIDPELVKKFEQQHNTKIRMIYFETDDMRDNMLLTSNGEGYDVVLCAGESIRTYVRQGWLAEITEQQVSNIRLIESRWRKAFPLTDQYAVPYFWGTLGIAYRQDLLGYEINSWSQLFNPNSNLKGKIIMVNTADDVIGMALKSLGFSANSTNPSEYKKVEKLLMKQKPFVKDYSYISMNDDSALVKGDVYAVMAYSGDALTLMDFNSEIDYVLPKEGGGIWIDYLAVMQSSDKKELAFKFIQFLNEPEHAAKLAEFVYYPSPNTEAQKLLSEEFLEDPITNPDQKTLQHSEFNKVLPARINKLRNNIFTRILQ